MDFDGGIGKEHCRCKFILLNNLNVKNKITVGRYSLSPPLWSIP